MLQDRKNVTTKGDRKETLIPIAIEKYGALLPQTYDLLRARRAIAGAFLSSSILVTLLAMCHAYTSSRTSSFILSSAGFIFLIFCLHSHGHILQGSQGDCGIFAEFCALVRLLLVK